MFLAHITDCGTQSLKEHCQNSAKIARDDLSCIELGNTAYLTALFHDCGKAHDKFQQYLIDSHNGKNVRKGSVIHSFAGISYFLNKYHNVNDPFQKITSEIISYSIGAHHGLFDVFNPEKQNGFTKRLTTQPEYDNKSVANFLGEVIDQETVCETFNLSVEEIRHSLKSISEIQKCQTEYFFYLGLLCRMISSAVMDGDRTDTANFLLNKKYNRTDNPCKVWKIINDNISRRIQEFSSDTVIRKSRRELSDICYNFAGCNSGVYRLNIPTGGGKTLSALRFAATHSLKREMNRIIYIAPLISILEQNADEIKNAVGNEYVLEHHSDVIVNTDDPEELDLRKYLEDSWDSPVIATTFVQFLNTLFSSKTSSVRRFQSLCNSVIIIDEIQSVPSKMISLFNLAINFLSKLCGCTILLCSATQPCLESVEHSIMVDGNIINEKDFRKYSEIFKRNTVTDCGNLRLEEIPAFVIDRSKDNRSVLVVCNKKAQAEFLFNDIKPYFKNCFHISAGMCVAHRKNVLKKIRNLLSENEPVICISTQVIEAGVDISFDCAIRFSAGMDNIIQTAGRCNRNGKRSSNSPVYIVHCSDENLKMLPDIQNAKQATESLIVNFKKNPDHYSNDLASDASINFYYRSLYASYCTNHFDYPIKDMPSLLEMLSDNPKYRSDTDYFLCQSFKTAGGKFDVFDSSSTSVIVPYGEGNEIINNLQSYYNDNNYLALQKEIKKAAQYSVSVYEYQFNKLLKENAVIPMCNGSFYVLSPEYYNDGTGLLEKKKEENICSILIL
ncbi:MAG TPA: hypothetical protein DCY31_01330 [Ruminococcaceae bacterium]|nr:hypothetical protein [Oscillospiraceae bacterium]